MNKEDRIKKELLDFLNRKSFDPILNTNENHFKDDVSKEKFRDVKKSTESEKTRFSQYETPKDIKSNYLQDLHSKAAKKINQELQELGLPQLPQFREEFLNLCNKLGVE